MTNNSTARFSILQPMMQYGFAGMCAVLLGILVWTMNKNDQRFDKVLEMQKETNQVIERNTAGGLAIEAAIINLTKVVHDKL